MLTRKDSAYSIYKKGYGIGVIIGYNLGRYDRESSGNRLGIEILQDFKDKHSESYKRMTDEISELAKERGWGDDRVAIYSDAVITCTLNGPLTSAIVMDMCDVLHDEFQRSNMSVETFIDEIVHQSMVGTHPHMIIDAILERLKNKEYQHS